MREQVSREKKTTTGFSIPSLKHPTRGFGLESSAISRQGVPEVQPLHKPVTHDISRIPLRSQAKLSISQPGDIYEQEADNVAQQVMQRMAQPVNHQSIQREALPEEELQMKPLVNSIMPLDAGLQRSMRQTMGAAFTGVKRHSPAQMPSTPSLIKHTIATPGIIQAGKRKAEVLTVIEPRSKRKKRVNIDSLPLHFSSPTYASEPAHIQAGGKNSHAILGPRSLKGMGTDANSALPRAIKRAREVYPECNFKAGHLLNADFYGDGENANNLTILTSSANTSQTAFDNKIKNALHHLTSLYVLLSKEYVDITTLQYGIDIRVTVSDGKWGTTFPESCIANQVICVAAINSDLNSVDASILSKANIQLKIQEINTNLTAANTRGVIDNTLH